MRETIKQLQERWTPEITAQTLADVSPRSPFGVLPSGFQDFRGFGYYDCLPDYLKKFPPPKYPPPSKEVVENFLERAWFETLDSFRFSSCDFTHARFLRAGVRNCDFQDCLFPSADMRLCTFIDTRFERCRFRSANFRRAFVDFGKLGETVFADCSFEKCNFAETSFMAPRFRRVAFSDCRSFLRFKASSFEDASFSGKFTGVWFNGGFDKIANRIGRFAQVESMFLMSGGYDLLLFVKGRNLQEVAQFVSSKLANMEGVLGTATHFRLKTYKDQGVLMENYDDDERLKVTP